MSVILSIYFTRNAFDFFEEAFVIVFGRLPKTYVHFFKAFNEEYRLILQRRCPFYNKLDDEKKRIFLHRVIAFINKRQFTSHESITITNEMKVLIAASAVMLTFGYRKYLLDSFDKVHLFPSSYYSQFTGSYHVGEANDLGYIVFSWQHFEESWDVGDDSYHLGLHEFAHALYMQIHYKTGLADTTFKVYVDDWEKYIHDEFILNQIRDKKILREYAFTDSMEFFAVTAECFFENPKLLKEGAPELYEIMRRLLNQDLLK